jgi:hypothetical protein
MECLGKKERTMNGMKNRWKEGKEKYKEESKGRKK